MIFYIFCKELTWPVRAHINKIIWLNCTEYILVFRVNHKLKWLRLHFAPQLPALSAENPVYICTHKSSDMWSEPAWWSQPPFPTVEQLKVFFPARGAPGDPLTCPTQGSPSQRLSERNTEEEGWSSTQDGSSDPLPATTHGALLHLSPYLDANHTTVWQPALLDFLMCRTNRLN